MSLKRKSPLVTLAVGAVLAAVLLILDMATTDTPTGGYGAAPVKTTSGASAAAPTAAPPATATPTATLGAPTTPPATGLVTYAGDVGGAGASLAIAVHNGTAVAYVCDGKKAEAWLQGTAAGGVLTMAGAHGATLTGTYANGRATGKVGATGKTWTFDLPAVKPPSGLYRASATVRGAKVVGGWIVLPDGRQVGLLDVGEAQQVPPTLDPNSPTVTVDGTAVPVTPVDGTPVN